MTRPGRPARVPPFRPDFPCHRNPLPNINGPAGRVGPADPVVSHSAGASAAREDGRENERGSGSSEDGQSVSDELLSTLDPYSGEGDGQGQQQQKSSGDEEVEGQ